MPPTFRSGSPAREIRLHTASIELRAAAPGSMSVGTLVGYAAVYDPLSEDLGGFRERLRKGVFDRSLSSAADVVALKNHNEDLILGRSEPGTLRMVSDEIGLRVEIDLADDTLGRDTAVNVGRRDISKMSFAFLTVVDEWDLSGTVPIRTLVDVDLVDVSIVTWPAYKETSVALRSLEAARSAPPATPPPSEAPAPAAAGPPPVHPSVLDALLRLAEAG
jgi:HK97 family phage prohead protease